MRALFAASVRMMLAVLAMAAAPLPLRAAHADPVIKETITTYPVSGKTAKAVRTDINARRKAAGGGSGYDSVNHWETHWNFRTVPTAGGCMLSDIVVRLDIEIVIPELAPSAPAALRQRFDAYIEKLMVHERGHSTLSVATAREIDAGMRALGPMPTCMEMSAAARELGQSLLKEGRQADKDYDARTRHGATQGATYP
ncbi:MAG TPA: DUF922 domain-containing protein [Hyphomonadaceae bacterium]|jgi:predicted secreted Zn-dependent protease|nr:DUF922 domain-containing protein [Hyphomonadaceae bacterium]